MLPHGVNTKLKAVVNYLSFHSPIIIPHDPAVVCYYKVVKVEGRCIQTPSYPKMRPHCSKPITAAIATACSKSCTL